MSVGRLVAFRSDGWGGSVAGASAGFVGSMCANDKTDCIDMVGCVPKLRRRGMRVFTSQVLYKGTASAGWLNVYHILYMGPRHAAAKAFTRRTLEGAFA